VGFRGSRRPPVSRRNCFEVQYWERGIWTSALRPVHESIDPLFDIVSQVRRSYRRMFFFIRRMTTYMTIVYFKNGQPAVLEAATHSPDR
jgi:hypothetical protein